MLVVQENRVSCGFQSNTYKEKTHALSRTRVQKRIVCVTVCACYSSGSVHACRIGSCSYTHTYTRCSIESIEIIIDARVMWHFACACFFHMYGCWHRRDFNWREYITQRERESERERERERVVRHVRIIVACMHV